MKMIIVILALALTVPCFAQTIELHDTIHTTVRIEHVTAIACPEYEPTAVLYAGVGPIYLRYADLNDQRADCKVVKHWMEQEEAPRWTP
jgi:hypothetical protein